MLSYQDEKAAIGLGQSAALIRFNGQTDDYVCDYVQSQGVPADWLPSIRKAYGEFKAKLYSLGADDQFAAVTWGDELVLTTDPFRAADVCETWKVTVRHLHHAMSDLVKVA